MILLISILIVYGITLILVQGKIFEPLKIKLSLFVDWFHNKLDPSDESVAEWIEAGKLGDNHQKLWNESLRRLEVATSETQNEAVKFNKKIFEDIRGEITSRSSLIKFGHWFFNKLQILLQCMMCTGFWVGVLFCLITLCLPIQVFGTNLLIISSAGMFNKLISIFLISCLFSGTTWVIHNITDLLYELKEKLADLGK